MAGDFAANLPTAAYINKSERCRHALTFHIISHTHSHTHAHTPTATQSADKKQEYPAQQKNN